MNFRKKCDFMIQTVDFLILDLIQNKLRCKFLDSLMIKCSSLGDGGIIWIAISFLLICYKKYRQAGVLILVGLIMGVLIGNCLLKNIICRPRPCWINRAVSLLIPIPYDYSFPSCHTMSSFIAAAVLLHTDIMFAYPAFLLASVIAFSRLYLYVHYPSDIIGGIALVQLSHTSYAYYSTISNNFTPCGGTVEMIVLSFSSAFYFPILRLFLHSRSA